MSIAAVVLAAGGSTRFGEGNKLLAPFRGRPLYRWAVDAALGAALDETVVITGAVELQLSADVTTVRNEAWATGLGSSLQAALAWARERDHDAVVVGLADQPLVGAEAWQRVAAAGGPIAVAVYGGARGNPVLLAREVWGDLPAEGDAGARVLMRHRPDLVREVPCEGSAADVDTLEDLARWS